MGKTLSVSIASYNVERFLDNTLSSLCVDSVLDDIEVIIVNDGSKDSTPSIALSYVEKYPQSFILINKGNGGYGSTINASLAVATGKYYKLLDGDDWFLSENLSSFIEALKMTESDIIYTPFYFVEEPEMTMRIETFSFAPGTVLPVSDIYAVSMHATAVRTDVIRNRIRITEHCFYTDFEFCLKTMLLSSTLTYFDIPIYCYRIGQGEQSVSVKGYLKHMDEHEYMTKWMLGTVFGSDRFPLLRKQTENMARRHVNILIVNGDRKRYLDFIRYLRRNYPSVPCYESSYQKLVSLLPHLLYAPVSAIKRCRCGL